MHFIRTQAALVFTLSLNTVICAVASPADIHVLTLPPSRLSKSDGSVQILAFKSISSSVGSNNTTGDKFDTITVQVSSDLAITKSNTYAIDEQPEYCPSDEEAPVCRDCGGATYIFYREFEYYDARCKGLGDEAYLKDCSCLEMSEEELEENTIGCTRLGDDPDAWHEKAGEAFANLPDLTSESFWDNDKDRRVGDSDDEQEHGWVECIL